MFIAADREHSRLLCFCNVSNRCCIKNDLIHFLPGLRSTNLRFPTPFDENVKINVCAIFKRQFLPNEAPTI